MRARTNFIIDAAIMVAYVVATNPIATGTPLHEWLAIGVALAAFVHLVLHWEWTVNAVRRFIGRLNTLSRVNLVVDAGLLVAGVATAMSGLLVSQSALRVFGYVASETSVWHRVHSEASTLLLALIGMHLGLHWSWAVSVFRNQVLKPLLARRDEGAGATAAAGPGRAAGSTAGRPASGRTGSPRSTGGSVVPALARTVSALALVGLVAATVWMAAPRAEAGLAWLVLPGESQVIERAEAAPVSTAATATAAHFEGSNAERVAVRVSHSLLVVAAAAFAGSALQDIFKGR